MSVCVYVRVCLYVHPCVYVCMYGVRTSVCTYVSGCMHMCIYIYSTRYRMIPFVEITFKDRVMS